MSKTRRWITLLLTIIVIILIGWNLANRGEDSVPVPRNNQQPTYTSDTSKTVVYNPDGGLAYQLVSQQVQYFDEQQVSWFEHPVLTTYDAQKNAVWALKADKARLTKNRMLYLYGHVEANSQQAESRLQQIKTDNAQINLVTQDVTSDDQVTLSGHGFNATGMRLRGNLRTKTAELLDKVKTSYEIQK